MMKCLTCLVAALGVATGTFRFVVIGAPSIPVLVNGPPALLPCAKVSPLKRRDVPPEGIAPQLQRFLPMPAPPPPYVPPPVPQLTVSRMVEIAEWFLVQSEGFVPKQDVKIQVLRPDKSLWHGRIETGPDGKGVLEGVNLLGAPLGVYTVAATQRDRNARSAFEVRRAAHPRILIWPWEGEPGSMFQIALGGFAPQQKIVLHIYRDDKYLTSLTIQVSKAGDKGCRWQTAGDDPPGRYELVANPRAAGLNSFVLR